MTRLERWQINLKNLEMTTKLVLSAALLLAWFSGKAQNKDTVSYAGKEGRFGWQFPDKDKQKAWEHYSYSTERSWGDFPENLEAPEDMFKAYPWAIGPVKKYA